MKIKAGSKVWGFSLNRDCYKSETKDENRARVSGFLMAERAHI